MSAGLLPWLNIRQAQLGEIDMISSLHQRGFSEAYPAINFESSPAELQTSAFSHQLTNFLLTKQTDTENTALYLASLGGRVAATAGLTVHHEDRLGEVWGIQVAKQYRGQNIAKLLLEHVSNVAEKKQVEELELHVVAASEKAIKLYKGLGFSGQDKTIFYDNCPRWSKGFGFANYLRMTKVISHSSDNLKNNPER